MDLTLIEQRLGNVADVVLVDPRLLRHIVKVHRDVSGLVPHIKCYAIRKAELLRIASAEEVGLRFGSPREWAVLVARQSAREAKRVGRQGAFDRVLRAAFHAGVHVALQSSVAEGRLDLGIVRHRIEQLGRTEFEEIRAALTHDDLLFEPSDDVEVYIEFCAVYLELLEFAPGLVVTTFPGLAERERVEEVLSADIHVDSLLSHPDTAPRSLRPPASGVSDTGVNRRPVSASKHARLLGGAKRLFKTGHHARSAMLAARARHVSDEKQSRAADRAFGRAVERLSERVDAALRGARPRDPESAAAWTEVIETLARHAAEHRRIGGSPEMLLLTTLQAAAVAHEKPGLIVDVPSWVLSLGRRSVVRPRRATRELEIARKIEAAADRLRALRLPAREREKVTRVVEAASSRAEENVRAALRPKVVSALRQSGLSASSGPERHARKKLVEELLDQVIDRGFFSLPQLRDAISRNAVKLRDLSGPAELVGGDPLLLADRRMNIALDGIYRRGDVYLRVLQKASSLPFGTRVGRLLTLYLILPLVGSFIVLEGIRYIIGPLVEWLGFGSIHPLDPVSFFVTAAMILALLHSELFRIFARQVLDVVALVLAWVFFKIPRAIVTRPLVRRWLANAAVRSVIRRFLVPLAVGAVIYFVTPASEEREVLRYASALAAFGITTIVMGSSIGWWLEDFLLEQLAPTWQVVSRRWLPDLLSMIGRVFAAMMDAFEQTIYRIGDALRFRRTSSPALLAMAAVLGTVWAVAAYVMRFYMTLLVEPEINPLKHFPVVTVAHKIMLPFLPDLLAAIEPPFRIFGPIIGGAIAGLTVFLLPSVFGFLVWELKANYKLYRATRSETIPSTRFGPHGETMRGLLVHGVHSGTLPKLYERLRRAAQRHDERLFSRFGQTARAKVSRDEAGVARFREGLRVVQRALDRFVERELLTPLVVSRRWKLGRVRIERIDLSSNRVRVQLGSEKGHPALCGITFEQLGGRIIAGIDRAGFLAELDEEHALLFENTLAVFYHRAEVELVREQIESEVAGVHYDIVEEGLVTWPDEGHDTELLYRLDIYRPRLLRPRVHGARSIEPRPLDSRRVLYAHQRISWRAWEQAWAVASEETGSIPRLLAGRSILPGGVTKPEEVRAAG